MTTAPRKALPTALTALLLLLLVGCESQPGSGLPTVPVRIGSKTFTLEVADSTQTRTYGLMRRDSMPDDHGMLFVFGRQEPLSFWMKNTRIPLDIIYVDAAGRVVSVKQMKPYDLNGTPSDAPAQYAIELNQGAAAAAGVQPGMAVNLPNGLRAKD